MMIMEDEIVESSSKKSEADILAAQRVKEAIRQSHIRDFLDIINSIFSNSTSFDDEVVDDAIECLEYLIDWNELTLFEGFI